MRNSKVIQDKLPCPSCPSSDAYHIYDDGHGYCFSCKTYTSPKGGLENTLNTYSYEYIPLRGLEKRSLIKYDIKTKIDPEGKPIAVGFTYPNGATKVRKLDNKEFYWVESENTPHVPGLFGKDKFSSGENKHVVITEGEFDCASLYQVLGCPVVSVQSSSSGVRDCTADRAWLNGFERVYLAFDNDTAGRECAANVAKLFDFNKVYRITFDKFKDANEYLQHGESVELLNIWNNARKYQPDTIVSTFSEFDKILKEVPKEGVPYPFPSLNEMTYGIRTGESVLITAQEGVGKTELMHAIEYQLLTRTKENVGSIYLEEPKRRHLQALAGLELRKPVHLPDTICGEDEISSALQKVVGSDERLHIYSHFGSNDPDDIIDTIRFLVSARNCRYILLDHISMVVSGLAGEDERRALDYLSTRLEMMVVELDFALILVSHVNDLGQTRGSRNIGKVANIRIDASRDTGASDPITRNTTTLVISKNRFSGKTGIACKLLFNPETYSYSEIEDDVWNSNPIPHSGTEGVVSLR